MLKFQAIADQIAFLKELALQIATLYRNSVPCNLLLMTY